MVCGIVAWRAHFQSSSAAALPCCGKLLHSAAPALQYPSEASNGSFFYFSSEQGPAHGIWLSPYVSHVPACCCMNSWLCFEPRALPASGHLGGKSHGGCGGYPSCMP